ncbi:MAG: hypothetical protein V2A74_15235, partial [bacterium]
LKKRSGFLVDVSAQANRRLDDNEKGTGWAGLGADLDLSSFPIAQTRFHEIEFRVGRNDVGASAILLSGMMNPVGGYPQSVDFRLGDRNVSQLHFLMTTAFPAADGREVGEIIVQYKDGSLDRKPLLYGTHLFAFNDYRMSRETWFAWQGKTKNETPVGLHDVIWTNLAPEKPIAVVSLRSAGTEAAPILLAITGVN